MSNPNELMLIDLSGIAYPIWMTAGNQPDQDYTSQQIVARVRSLTVNHPHAALCCDSGRSFRHDAVPSYKANRPERVEALHHQIRLARERLEADGYPVWVVRGFEADDIIATAATKALAIGEDVSVLVVSGDKDLLQLVGPRLRVMGATSGQVFDVEGVRTKYGIQPEQIRDYLTLVGDSSDNVRGAEKIGPVKAANLLTLFGTLDEVYRAIDDQSIRTQPSILASLIAFRPRLDEVRNLITLRTDVEIPFHEISAERTPKDLGLLDDASSLMGEEPMLTEDPSPGSSITAKNREAIRHAEQQTGEPSQVVSHTGAPDGSAPVPSEKPPSTALVHTPSDVLDPAPKEWERGLDPRSMKDAEKLAINMFKSRMFSAYGSPEAVLSTVMLGRELGLPAMASLRSVHIIEGKHALSAALMRALVLRSGLAEYFEPVEFTDTSCTFVTKRVGARKEVSLTHTIEMARRAWSKEGPDSWDKSGWGRNPEDMLVARTTARLARLIYPDLLAGLYTPEELEEIRILARAA